MIETICEIIKIISATFLGASAAFYFDRHKSKIEEINKNYSACLKAQHVFYQYYEVLYNIKHQFLNTYEADVDRAFKLKHISFGDRVMSLDIGELSFMLSTKEPDILGQITNIYNNCIACLDSVRERNEQYKKVSEKAILQEDGSCAVPVTVEMVFLKDYTDNMYKQFSDTIPKIEQVDKEMQEFIKKHFKGRRALQAVNIKEDT